MPDNIPQIIGSEQETDFDAEHFGEVVLRIMRYPVPDDVEINRIALEARLDHLILDKKYIPILLEVIDLSEDGNEPDSVQQARPNIPKAAWFRESGIRTALAHAFPEGWLAHGAAFDAALQRPKAAVDISNFSPARLRQFVADEFGRRRRNAGFETTLLQAKGVLPHHPAKHQSLASTLQRIELADPSVSFRMIADLLGKAQTIFKMPPRHPDHVLIQNMRRALQNAGAANVYE